MGKRDTLIAKYAADLRDKIGVEPDPGLLEKVTINCGPAIYDPASECITQDDPADLARLKENFLVRKLGVPEGPTLDAAVDAVFDAYGGDEPAKYRAVVHYMLVLHFEKEALFA